MNKKQRIAQIVLNVVIIAELCASVILAGKEPDLFSVIFFKYFFMMLIPTVFLGIYAIKILRTKETQPEAPLNDEEQAALMKARKSAPLIRNRKPPPSSREMPKILTQGHGELVRLSKWKSILLKTAALCLCIAFISLIDSCQAKFRTPLNVFNVLPGATIEISGPLEKLIPIGELTYVSASEQLRLSFSEVRTGIFLGGAMWIGHLTVSPDTKPGEYRVMAVPSGYKPEPEKPLPLLLVTVHEDQLSLRKSFKSFIRRASGIPPWRLVAFCVPFAGFSLGIVFLISRKTEHLLAREGKAEVYRVRQGETGFEIAFGLGTRHGVAAGKHLALLDERGQPVETIVVQKVSETDSLAMASFESDVMPGYIVSMDNHHKV